MICLVETDQITSLNLVADFQLLTGCLTNTFQFSLSLFIKIADFKTTFSIVGSSVIASIFWCDEGIGSSKGNDFLMIWRQKVLSNLKEGIGLNTKEVFESR